MVKRLNKRHEMVVIGLGGAGVLTVGRQVAMAGSTLYKYVTYYPSYSWQMRGGSSECAVILSNENINCPILEKSENILVLAPHLVKNCLDRVRSGGLVVVGSLGMEKGWERGDFRAVIIPDVEKEAAAIGNLVVANTIMLGAYIQLTGAMSPDLLEAELNRQFADKAKVLEMNKRALNRGIELAKKSGC